MTSIKDELLAKRNIWLLTFTFFEACFVVLQKRLAVGMVHYPYVLTLTQPMCTTVLFGICALVTRLPSCQRFQQKFVLREQHLQHESDEISQLLSNSSAADKPFPKYKFAVLGLLFTLTNFGMFTGSRGNLVPGPLIVILRQAAIPFTMAISFLVLKKKFLVQHYIGALIILGGIIFSLYPELGDMKQHGPFWAILLILLSAFTLASATVYMEHSLQNYNLEIFEMWTWTNLFEIFFALPLILAMVPIQGLSMKDIPDNVGHGYSCLFEGVDSLKGDQCSYIGYWFLAFIIFIVLDKVNQAYIIKHNSSTLMWIASTCSVPLSSIAFTFHFIMGKTASELDWQSIVGLCIVLVGLVVYRSARESSRKNENEV